MPNLGKSSRLKAFGLLRMEVARRQKLMDHRTACLLMVFGFVLVAICVNTFFVIHHKNKQIDCLKGLINNGNGHMWAAGLNCQLKENDMPDLPYSVVCEHMNTEPIPNYTVEYPGEREQ